MKAWQIGGAISGVMTALGLVLASGPWVALIVVLGAALLMFLYKADTIFPAFGEMKIRIAQARRIEASGNRLADDPASRDDLADLIQLPKPRAPKTTTRRPAAARPR